MRLPLLDGDIWLCSRAIYQNQKRGKNVGNLVLVTLFATSVFIKKKYGILVSPSTVEC
jgi:hypothetical protein